MSSTALEFQEAEVTQHHVSEDKESSYQWHM